MTKRADGQFGRAALDHYPTPAAAVAPLIPHLKRTKVQNFVEPCAGAGDLIQHIEAQGFTCVFSDDIRGPLKLDARAYEPRMFKHADTVITNPPWEAKLMAEIMWHLSDFVPSWFLIYSDWLFTHQSAKLVGARCTDIVPIGRVKWFPESKSVGFDNCAWVRLDSGKKFPTSFWPMATKS